MLYNDKSPMENHHLAAAWALLNQPDFNILAQLDKPTRSQMRKLIIDLVLATECVWGRVAARVAGRAPPAHGTARGAMRGRAQRLRAASATLWLRVLGCDARH